MKTQIEKARRYGSPIRLSEVTGNIHLHFGSFPEMGANIVVTCRRFGKGILK
jgi:hypothetical protein